jgi:HEAT repeat protein
LARARPHIGVLWALARIGKPHPDVLSVLKDRSGDAEPLVRFTAAVASLRLAPGADDMERIAEEALRGTDDVLRGKAVLDVLGILGADLPNASRWAAGILARGSAGQTRVRAAVALAQLGPKALPAREALVAALEDPVPGVRMAAAYALSEVHAATPPDAATTKALRATLAGPVWRAGAWAAVCLARAKATDGAVTRRLERASRIPVLGGRGWSPLRVGAIETDLPAAARKALGR